MTMGEPKIGNRLSQYARWQAQCLYIGGGLGGLALFGDLAKDSFAESREMRAWFITTVIVSATVIGYGYIQYYYAAAKLQNFKESANNNNESAVPGQREYNYPLIGYIATWIGIVCLVASAVLLSNAAWKSVSAPSHPMQVEIHPTQIEVNPAQVAGIEKWVQSQIPTPEEHK